MAFCDYRAPTPLSVLILMSSGRYDSESLPPFMGVLSLFRVLSRIKMEHHRVLEFIIWQFWDILFFARFSSEQLNVLDINPPLVFGLALFLLFLLVLMLQKSIWNNGNDWTKSMKCHFTQCIILGGADSCRCSTFPGHSSEVCFFACIFSTYMVNIHVCACLFILCGYFRLYVQYCVIGSLLGQMFISTCCVWFELYFLTLQNCIITYLGLLVYIFGIFPKPNQSISQSQPK